MWTEQHRERYKRPADRAPHRMTDAEWAILEPLIPPASPGGRPRKTDMREAIDANLFWTSYKDTVTDNLSVLSPKDFRVLARTRYDLFFFSS